MCIMYDRSAVNKLLALLFIENKKIFATTNTLLIKHKEKSVETFIY